MPTVTGLTAERMLEIEASAIIDGDIVGNDLVLKRYDEGLINAGNVRGPVGPPAIITCTSTTRPASADRYDGLHIYETDTKKLLVWNGFRFDPPWNLPWGHVAIGQVFASQGNIGSTSVDLTGLAITGIAVANRRWRVTGRAHFQSTVEGDLGRLDICDSANTPIDSAQARMTTSGTTVKAEADINPAAGSRVYKLRFVRSAGTGTLQMNASATQVATIRIEDLGPIGLPVA